MALSKLAPQKAAARLIEVRSVGRSGLDLLTLSSSHFDPERSVGFAGYKRTGHPSLAILEFGTRFE